MCEALLEPTPAAEDMCHHCTFRVLNGCRWELKSEFGNEKGPKNTKHKIDERPALFLARKGANSRQTNGLQSLLF